MVQARTRDDGLVQAPLPVSGCTRSPTLGDPNDRHEREPMLEGREHQHCPSKRPQSWAVFIP
jgi:hypothetical protein